MSSKTTEPPVLTKPSPPAGGQSDPRPVEKAASEGRRSTRGLDAELKAMAAIFAEVKKLEEVNGRQSAERALKWVFEKYAEHPQE